MPFKHAVIYFTRVLDEAFAVNYSELINKLTGFVQLYSFFTAATNSRDETGSVAAGLAFFQYKSLYHWGLFTLKQPVQESEIRFSCHILPFFCWKWHFPFYASVSGNGRNQTLVYCHFLFYKKSRLKKKIHSFRWSEDSFCCKWTNAQQTLMYRLK